MRTFIRHLALLLALLPVPAAAKPDAMPLLVSVDWLAEHIDHPELVLLHVGDRAAFEEAHIPGARFVSLDDISVSDHHGGLMLELPGADDLHRRLQVLGIGDASQVVVYFGKDWVSPATRVLFTLDAAGLGGRSALLDGGMKAWTQAGHETSKGKPGAASERTLSKLTLQHRIVDAGFVRAHLGTPGYTVIDGRAAAFYEGVDRGDSHGRKHQVGHIEGAQSLPFTEITGLDLKFKSREQLRAMFARIGIAPNDTVIAYCHIGQQATTVLLAARLLGHPVLLYDGAFEDWSQRDLPAIAGSEKTATE